MTPIERVLAVFRGEKPDVVPWFADLSHWYVVEYGRSYVPTNTEAIVDTDMIELHSELGVGIYLNMGAFFDTIYEGGDVREGIKTDNDLFIWRIETPLGILEERRRFSHISSSWSIEKRMITDVNELKILRYAVERRRYVPRYERFYDWEREVGDIGIPFASSQYSGFGFLISRAMGIENTIYAIYDAPDEVQKTVQVINENNLLLIDLLSNSPAPIIIHSDNLSSNVQSPALFSRFSASYYKEMASRLHAAGKWLSVHIDGRLKGLLSLLNECGVDCADAVTPAPMGDLSPEQCRSEAGPNLILWGGLPPSIWGPSTSDEEFTEYIKRWLALRTQSHRLVIAPGDQVPPGTKRSRIRMVAELVERYGVY